MKMVSLKREEMDAYCAPADCARYSYGLRIYLSEDDCEALGIVKAVRAGTQVSIKAQAVVVSSTETVGDDADDTSNEVSLSLQITDMGIEAGPVLRNAARVLYGSEE